MIRIACAQYPVERLPDLAAWEAKQHRWLSEAAEADADLVVFPEYGAMELTGLWPESVSQNQSSALSKLQDLAPAFHEFWSSAAQTYGIHILAPCFLEATAENTYENRARLHTPAGRSGSQTKRMRTRYEEEVLHLQAGSELRVFDTDLGRIGIAICYDIEFAAIARAQAVAGAWLILAPSCTDALAGANRVRIGARARALENQCYVATAPLLGDAPWAPAIDENVGQATIAVPPDVGQPADGLLATGELNRPGWVYADIDPYSLIQTRNTGQVRIFDQHAELGAALEAKVVDLR